VQHPGRTSQNLKHGVWRERRLDPIASHTANFTWPHSPIIRDLTSPRTYDASSASASCTMHLRSWLPTDSLTVHLDAPENHAIQLILDPRPPIRRKCSDAKEGGCERRECECIDVLAGQLREDTNLPGNVESLMGLQK
jgi:hypothetical protein